MFKITIEKLDAVGLHVAMDAGFSVASGHVCMLQCEAS
jgi:hypothetical protein